MEKKVVCRTCLEKSDEHEMESLQCIFSLDQVKTLGQALEDCVSEICLQLTNSPSICKRCSELLRTNYIFKKRCDDTEKALYDYMEVKKLNLECNHIELMEVLKIQNFQSNQYFDQSLEKVRIKTEPISNCDIVRNIDLVDSKKEVVCRTCLSVNEANKSISLRDTSNTMEGKVLGLVLEDCISGLCLQLTDSSSICEHCNEMLKQVYTFKQLCCNTEEKIYTYMKLNNLHLDQKYSLDLNDIHISTEMRDNMKDSKIEIKEVDLIEHKNEQLDLKRPKRKASKAARTKIEYLEENNLGLELRSAEKHTKVSRSENKKSSLSEQKLEVKSVTRHFKCRKCQYKAYRMDLLVKHKMKCKNRTRKYEEIYDKVCEICSKRFIRASHLKRHLFTHTT